MRFNKLPEDDNQPKNDEPYNENQQLLPGAEQPKGQTKKKNIFHQHAIYPTCNYPIPKPIRFIGKPRWKDTHFLPPSPRTDLLPQQPGTKSD